MKKKIADNVRKIRENVARACDRVKRDPAGVRVIAVTKMVEVDAIRMLLSLGHADIAESRVQQLQQRAAMIQESLSRRIDLPGAKSDEEPMVKPRWHMVGHLQRNKVKPILPLIEYIHSVDSLRLAEEINTAAARLGLADKVRVFLEVNTSQERQKFGLAVGAVSALADQIRTLPNLELVGLMTMAPLTDDMNECRFCFSRLREIFEEIRGERLVGPAFKHLSMGMSRDYEIAIEEGATMVRLGSAVFGE